MDGVWVLGGSCGCVYDWARLVFISELSLGYSYIFVLDEVLQISGCI